MPEGAIEPVPFTTDLPYRRICLLKVRRASGKPRLGTGWFFGPSLVITAGHVVTGASHDDVSVWPARHNSTDRPFGVWNSVRIVPSLIEDYAGIVVNEPVGDRVGTFGIADLAAIATSGRAVVAGYNENDDGHTQYVGTGAVTTRSTVHFTYGILTVAAQSGSPVWLSGSSDLVAGIHVSDGQAVLITDEVLSELLRWRDIF